LTDIGRGLLRGLGVTRFDPRYRQSLESPGFPGKPNPRISSYYSIDKDARGFEVKSLGTIA
jgi:hypothetical protein